MVLQPCYSRMNKATHEKHHITMFPVGAIGLWPGLTSSMNGMRSHSNGSAAFRTAPKSVSRLLGQDGKKIKKPDKTNHNLIPKAVFKMWRVSHETNHKSLFLEATNHFNELILTWRKWFPLALFITIVTGFVGNQSHVGSCFLGQTLIAFIALAPANLNLEIATGFVGNQSQNTLIIWLAPAKWVLESLTGFVWNVMDHPKRMI